MGEIIDDNILYDTLLSHEELNDFDEFNLNDDEFVRALGSLENLTINVSKKGHFSEETLRQINLILERTGNLKSLRIDNGGPERIDISSLFSYLPTNIESVAIKNLDLTTGIDQSTLDNLTNLKSLMLSSCDIDSIPMLPNEEAVTMLYSISSIPNEEMIKFGLHHKLQTTNEEVRTVLFAYSGKSALPLDLYKKYEEIFKDCDKDICIAIKNVSELDLKALEELKENAHIKEIFIQDGCFKHDDGNGLGNYSLEEYAMVRTEIDKIVSQIDVPDINDKDREKKIFAQIYKILGETIEYDYYAISPAGQLDEKLKYDCRTLKNALLGVDRNREQKQNLTVCAGFADALKNVSSCFGIECEFLGSKSDEALEKVNGSYMPKKDKDGKTVYRNGTTDPMGHAYNVVTLDGKTYYTDLTWDQPSIKAKRYPLQYFLLSADEFEQSHADVGFSAKYSRHAATQTLSINEQSKLFGEEISFKVHELESMLSENYLAGFVSQYFSEVKNGRGAITPKELLEMMASIKSIEDHILARGNRYTNMSVQIGEDKSFVFETSDPEKLATMKKEIKKRRERNEGDYDEL